MEAQARRQAADERPRRYGRARSLRATARNCDAPRSHPWGFHPLMKSDWRLSRLDFCLHVHVDAGPPETNLEQLVAL